MLSLFSLRLELPQSTGELVPVHVLVLWDMFENAVIPGAACGSPEKTLLLVGAEETTTLDLTTSRYLFIIDFF